MWMSLGCTIPSHTLKAGLLLNFLCLSFEQWIINDESQTEVEALLTLDAGGRWTVSVPGGHSDAGDTKTH